MNAKQFFYLLFIVVILVCLIISPEMVAKTLILSLCCSFLAVGVGGLILKGYNALS